MNDNRHQGLLDLHMPQNMPPVNGKQRFDAKFSPRPPGSKSFDIMKNGSADNLPTARFISPRNKSKLSQDRPLPGALEALSRTEKDINRIYKGLRNAADAVPDPAETGPLPVASKSEEPTQSPLIAEVKALKNRVQSAIAATKEALALEALERQRLTKDCDVLAHQLQQATADRAIYSNQLKELEQKWANLIGSASQQPSANEKEKGEFERLALLNDRLQAENVALESKVVALEADLQDARSQSQTQAARRQDSVLLPDVLGASGNKFEDLYQHALRRMERAIADNASLSEQLRQVRQEMAVTSANLESASITKCKLEENVKSAKASVKLLSKQLASEKNAHSKTQQRVRTVEAELGEVREQRAALQQQVFSLESRVQHFQNAMVDHEGSKDDHRQKMQLQTELTAAVKASHRLHAENEDLRRQLADMRSQPAHAFARDGTPTYAQRMWSAPPPRPPATAPADPRMSSSPHRTPRDDLLDYLREQLGKASHEAEEATVREITQGTVMGAELRSLKDRLAIVEGQREASTQTLHSVQAQLAKERLLVREMQDQLAAAKAKAALLDGKVQALDAQVIHESEHVKIVENRAADLEHEREQLLGRLEAANGQVATEHAESIRLRAAVAGLEADKQDLETKLHTVQGENGAYETSVRFLQARLQDERVSREEMAQLESSLRSLRMEAHAHDSTSTYLHSQLDTATSLHAAHAETVSTLNTQLDDLKRSHAEQVQLLHLQLDEEREARAASEELIRALQATLNALRRVIAQGSAPLLPSSSLPSFPTSAYFPDPLAPFYDDPTAAPMSMYSFHASASQPLPPQPDEFHPHSPSPPAAAPTTSSNPPLQQLQQRSQSRDEPHPEFSQRATAAPPPPPPAAAPSPPPASAARVPRLPQSSGGAAGGHDESEQGHRDGGTQPETEAQRRPSPSHPGGTSDAERAATAIQSVVRGQQVRRSLPLVRHSFERRLAATCAAEDSAYASSILHAILDTPSPSLAPFPSRPHSSSSPSRPLSLTPLTPEPEAAD